MASSNSKNVTKQTQDTTQKQKQESKTTNKNKTKEKTKSTTTSSGSSSTSSSSITAAVGEVDANTQAKYDKYNSSEYQQSQSVTDAYNKLQQTLNNKPGDFSSGYKDQLDNIYNQIANREKFSYDFNKDAMYQLYKDRYVEQGKQAMKDTMGQASQLTGGYGSSYSQTAGQQAYQNYLQALNDEIPTLRAQAFQEYESEGNRLNNQFSLANQMYGNDWQQYRAAMSDYQTDRGFYQGAYEGERNFDYGKYTSDRDYTASQYWNQRNAVQATQGSSNTNTTNKSTTTGTSTSSSTGTSKTTSNSLLNSLTNSLSESNTSSFSSGSGGSGGSGGSNGSTKYDYSDWKPNPSGIHYSAKDVAEELAYIARQRNDSGYLTKYEQNQYLDDAVKKGYITPDEMAKYLEKYKLG